MRYFRLFENLYVPGRWYLGSPIDGQGQDAGSWLFMQGEPASVAEPLRVGIYREGMPLDFSLADAGAIPVVTEKVAAVFKALAPKDVQVFPIQVERQPEPYFLINASRLVKCIDDQASQVAERWTPEDGDAERVGEYRNVMGLRVDPAKVGDAKVFRPWGWTVVLIVSEDLKTALEHTGATGLHFTEV